MSMKLRATALLLLGLAALWVLRAPSSRAAAPFGRFTVGTVTVTDNVTGLMWQRGFTPGFFGGITSGTANTYCEGLTLAGLSDWRLPSAKELMTLWDEYETTARIDEGIFAPSVNPFWSSSMYPNNATFGMEVTYTPGGGPGPYQYNFGGNARCVRTVPTDGGT